MFDQVGAALYNSFTRTARIMRIFLTRVILTVNGVISMRSRDWRLLLSAFALGLLISGDVSACPNCKEAVSAQPAEVARMAQGYNWSILLMLSMPLTLIGTGAFMVHRAVQRGTMPEL